MWGPFMDWDLTQPQATLIAGFVAGPFLITAAYIAFHGQRENMKTERQKFDEQIELQKEQAKADLKLKRAQWSAEQRLTNARNYRDRDAQLFARVLAYYADCMRKLDRTLMAIPVLPVKLNGDPVEKSDWAAAERYLAEAISAAEEKNDFASELRLAGYSNEEQGINAVHTAMTSTRRAVESAVPDMLQGSDLDAVVGEPYEKFKTAFNDLTVKSAEALAVRDEDVSELTAALESIED